jgi:hypothetical protein
MGTATLRPNTTIQAGTGITLGGGAASASAALSDASDSTYVQTSTYQSSVWGDTAPATAVPVVAFADATGTIPAGRTITKVQFYIRGKNGSTGSTSPASGSLRYSDNVEATYLSFDTTGGIINQYVTTLNTAQTSSGGNKGSWTYALVDGLKCAIGQDGTTGTSQMMDVWLVVTYTDQPNTPTNVTPASGASVTTDTPNLTATMSGTGTGSGYTIEWQLATDSGFTANVKTITSTALASNGTWTQAVTSGNALSPGTWYIRARAKDQLNTYSAYSTATSFTVSHPATATSLTPTGGGTLAYVSPTRLSWTFSDTSSTDTQSAYQVVLERNDTAQVITDTGKLTSTNKFHDMTIATTYKGIMLRWKVQVWDDNNTSAGYSAYSLFMPADAATVAITAPTAGQVVANGSPTTSWTVGGAATQVKYKVDYKLTNGTVVHSSGTITDANARSYSPSTNILQNTTNYQVTVSVTDSNGLIGTATQSFSTNYPTPSAVTSSADNTNLVNTGYINVDWSQQTADSTFVQWNVYRRLMGTTTWTKIYSTTSVNTRNYHDWTFPAGNILEYSVTQTATRSGVNVEGAPDSNPPDIDGTDGNYWLINPYDETVNMLLDNVTDDSFTDEYEQESFVIIGRGRKVNYGTRAGYTGSITCKFRDDANGRTARQKRLQLELLKATRNLYYLRNPFGDVMQVALGNIQISRIAGVGSSEFCDVTIPYEQVF